MPTGTPTVTRTGSGATKASTPGGTSRLGQSTGGGLASPAALRPGTAAGTPRPGNSAGSRPGTAAGTPRPTTAAGTPRPATNSAGTPRPATNAGTSQQALGSDVVDGAVVDAEAGKAAEAEAKKSSGPPDNRSLEQRVVDDTVRVMSALALYFTLIPPVLVTALREVYMLEGLATALAVSGALSIAHTGFWWFRLKLEPPYMLDLALLLLYVIYLPVYVTKLGYRPDMVQWVNVVQYGWIAAVMAASMAAGYPWALQHAKEASPQVAWASRTFRAVVDQVAWTWAGGMLIAGLLPIVPGALGQSKMQILNIVFNYVWPYVTIVALLSATRFWPAIIRNRHYLPKLHQGSVEPGVDGVAAAAGGDGSGALPGGQGGAPLAPGQQPGAPGQLLLGPDGLPLPLQQQQQQPPGTPGAYPPTPGTFPPTPGAYPPTPGTFPPTPGAYPPTPGTFPPTPGAYPPTPGTFPPTPGAYPPTPGTYPLAPGSPLLPASLGQSFAATGPLLSAPQFQPQFQQQPGAGYPQPGGRGNCNAQLGACECPWPFIGDACGVDRLSMCYDAHDTTLRHDAMPSCGFFVPKSCECYKQCVALFCPPDAKYNANCYHEQGQRLGQARCFFKRGLPVENQTSVVVARNSSVQLDWFNVPDDTVWARKQKPTPDPAMKLDAKKEWKVGEGGRSTDSWVVPLDECPERCNERGACVFQQAGQHQKENRTHCICRKGWKAPNCSEVNIMGACWFDPWCSGHGSCKSGFCHCKPGWWGIDCSRSKAYELREGAHAVLSKHKLKIYMYDLPSHVTFAGEYDDGAYTRDPMYIAYEYFLKYYLKDWSVRTENPHEANLFFIPALLYFYVGNVRDPVPHLDAIVTYINTTLPFWQRHGGRDHFWWMTGDHGACHLPARYSDLPIKLVHFGLSAPSMPTRFGKALDQDYACLRPERDVVTPPVTDFFPFSKDGGTVELYEHVLANNGSDGRNRTLLFFFAGGVREDDMTISGGARQAVAKVLRAHANDTEYSDILFKEGRVDNYDQMFLNSTFCIAPYGYGWGLRLPIAVVHGCVPIITQDHTWQPFEELLPYEEFSVRISNADLPNIVPILRAYSQEQIDRMRLALAKHWGAFVWPVGQGGLAYNYTIAALKRRMHNMESQYYLR
ncbi:hypothetical protein FOA52_012485 [Chlamydomonas sp. UWO 241]|nr:hypothetical protein FOA52_012485 [Chlamydomonas sp. UWO 241]